MVLMGVALVAALVAAFLVVPIARVLVQALRHKRHGTTSMQRRRRGLFLWLLPGWLLGTTRAVDAAGASEPAAQATGRLLCTLQLQNDSDAAQQAHFVTPMFGQGFRQGDVPVGERPRFVLPDGRECQATLWGISSWPDGSMKFCAAMVLVPAAVRVQGHLALQVRTGSAAADQAAGTRSLAELHDADLQVVLDGVSALDGTWKASLSDGIRKRTDVVQIASGPAGAIWRVGSEFRNATGNAHGQLYCWHYVAALSDASGALAGLRYLGRVAQPWTDVERPPAQHREFSASLYSGSRRLRALLGHTSTETPGETIRLPHYASFFTAGPEGRWDFVPATGGAAADCTVRVIVDVAYCIAARLIPPYDLTTPLKTASAVDYRPMGRGTMVRAMGTTGERADIGLLPEWNVRHLIQQSAEHERIARVNGLCAAGWRTTLRKRETLQPVPAVDIRPSYPKLGKPEVRWRGYSYTSGMVKPSPNESLWREDTAHRPGAVYWPYLFSGEPQYLDLLVEIACAHILELHPGNLTTWGVNFPRSEVLEGPWRGERGICIGTQAKLYKGSGVLLHGTGGTRMSAWRSRDVAQAAAITPDKPADGAGTREYLRDVMDSAYAAFRDYMSQVPASYRESGLFIQSTGNGAPWQIAYLAWSVCHQADILGTPQPAYVRSHLSRFWESFARQADMACIVAYTCNYRDTNNNLAQSTRDVLGLLQCNLNFDAATSRVTPSAGKDRANGDWQARNGDRFTFSDKQIGPLKNFQAIQPRRQFYAVNCSGQSFQLALQPDGPPIKFPESTQVSPCFASLKSFSPNVAFNPTNSASGYAANILGAVSYYQTCGEDVRTAVQSLERIGQALRLNFGDRPKYRVLGQRA
ncbi:MAG: hypothetical protein QM777_09435 [Pseudorhodoferax sp.]